MNAVNENRTDRDFKRLHAWHGGLQLPTHTEISTAHPLRTLPVPRVLILPLAQHIGAAAEPLVKVGDRVLKGQPIARAQGFVSAPIHASSSGTVVAIESRAVPHPSGLHAPCVIIETDGADKWRWRQQRIGDYTTLDPSTLRNHIREAGIVGLGGAGFPSFIKMNPGPGRQIDLLIANGAECEPYISCDDVLMRERAPEIVAGLQIMRHALQARACVIGIEDSKPEAIAAMDAAVAACGDAAMQLVRVPTLYPAGGEKQLIKTLTGLAVPSQGLPADIGMVCHNVGTAVAVYHAVNHSQPLISRIVTVTGGGVVQPRNLEVLIGTPMRELIAHAGGYSKDVDRLLVGGPMMGFALPNDELPVIKTTNCILAATKSELPRPQPEMPCIRCGECVQVCPADLLPQQLYWHARARDFDKVQDYHLFDCIECGCCAYVCPSHIPLVQYYRYAKTEIWSQERERRQADIARQRHEFRLDRIEREKQERAARLRARKQDLEPDAGAKTDPKQAAIQAALARVHEKKAAREVTPRNTDNLTSEQRRLIAEADARRAQANKDHP